MWLWMVEGACGEYYYYWDIRIDTQYTISRYVDSVKYKSTSRNEVSKMSKYLLSVCIPTANRKKELTEQLIRLITQTSRLGNIPIQIVICDNTDHHEQLIDVDVFNNSDIKYIKNAKNIGYGKNINSVIENADGEFIWLLSDDDFIFDNAVSVVVSNIMKYRNSNYIMIECGGAFNGELFSEKMYFSEAKSTYYKKGADFLNHYWNSIIFISINIFNRRQVIEHMHKLGLFDDINEVYQQALVGVTFISQHGEVLIIKEPLLNDNYGNKVYAPENINNVAVDKYHKLLNQFREHGVPSRVIAEMSNQLFGNVFFYGIRSIVYNIEYSKITSFSDVYKNIYKNKKNSVKVRIMSFVIFLLLVSNNLFAKFGLKFLLLIKSRGSDNYFKINEDLNLMVANSKSKITSTY